MSAALALTHPALAIEKEQPSWALEHFGADVTILRMGRSNTSATGGAKILLSCEGKDRRFRLLLPDDGARHLHGARSGLILIRPSGMLISRQTVLVTRCTFSGDHIVVASGDRANVADAVLSIGRILSEQPASLDLLIHLGPTPVILGRLIAAHVLLSFGPGDEAASREFVDVCGRNGR